MGMTEVYENEGEDEKPLEPNQYKWDKVCPLFISCLPDDRGHFAQSELVRHNYFVMQVNQLIFFFFFLNGSFTLF